MANTSKLSLILFQGSDIVDYNSFNSNFNKIDQLGDEYVIAHGSDGLWWYRKWSSGRMECGIDNNLKGNAECVNSWGGCFIHERPFEFGKYPDSGFSSRPYASVTFNYASSSAAAAAIVQKQQSGFTMSPPFYIIQPTRGTVTGCQFGIYCVGRWS